MPNHRAPRTVAVLVLWACLAAILAGATACAGSSNAPSSGSGATTVSTSSTDTTSTTGSTTGTDSTTTGTGSTTGAGTTSGTTSPPVKPPPKTAALFKTYVNKAEGFSILVPSQWISHSVPGAVMFVRLGATEMIRTVPKAPHTPKMLDNVLAHQVAAGHALHPDKARTLKFGPGHEAIVIDFERKPPKPLPGGQTVVSVREYVVAGKKKAAMIFLTAPKGISNTVAYDLIASSFRWQ